MGVIYKITDKIISFILEQKKASSFLSCRKISELVFKKFKINVSKSGVNEIIKQAGLSSKVGRARSRPKGTNLTLKDNKIILDRAGVFILAAAENELGLVDRLIQGLFCEKPSRKMGKIAPGLRTLLYLPLFDLTIDKLSSYDKQGLWEVTGGRVNPASLAKLANDLNARMQSCDKTKLAEKLEIKLAKNLHFGLIDGSIFYIDPQFRALWPSADIPDNLSVSHCFTDSYIKNTILEAKQPIILLSLAKNIGPETANFILSCQGAESKSISRMVIHGLGQELKKIVYIPAVKRNFIFGLFPTQQARLRIKLFPPIKAITAPINAKEYSVQEGEVIFPQLIVSQEIKLRCVLLKEGPGVKQGVLLATNFATQEKSKEDVAALYLRRWLKPWDSFAYIVNGFSQPPQFIYHNYINIMALAIWKAKPLPYRLNELDKILNLARDNLNTYVKQRYLPGECQSWDFLQLKRVLYELAGQRSMERDLISLELSPHADQQDKGALESLYYAAERINESSLMFLGKRLILKVKKA
ncbi:MAG: hypothetical protein Q8L26_03630 [Candidatus Omnitrophota bacterium]|nr:hypothetical protein [Candidatus Omnitrophota bacterium]